MQIKITEATTKQEIKRCFPVMRQLRTHFEKEEQFLEQVERQRREGYRLAFLEDAAAVRAVAGFRILEMLHAGRHCYVDDLITDAAERSLGHGGALFDWLVATAQTEGCVRLELDSGVQRFAAHRFYLTKRMIISSHHFSLEL
jgi:GNAT superfamily N-acetyltransferase